MTIKTVWCDVRTHAPIDDEDFNSDGDGVPEVVALFALAYEGGDVGTAELGETLYDGTLPRCLTHKPATLFCYHSLQAEHRHVRKLTGSFKRDVENEGDLMTIDRVQMIEGVGPRPV